MLFSLVGEAICQLMEMADVGTPDESATYEDVVQYVKRLSAVLGDIELTFKIKTVKLL